MIFCPYEENRRSIVTQLQTKSSCPRLFRILERLWLYFASNASGSSVRIFSSTNSDTFTFYVMSSSSLDLR